MNKSALTATTTCMVACALAFAGCTASTGGHPATHETHAQSSSGSDSSNLTSAAGCSVVDDASVEVEQVKSDMPLDPEGTARQVKTAIAKVDSVHDTLPSDIRGAFDKVKAEMTSWNGDVTKYNESVWNADMKPIETWITSHNC